MTPESLVSTRRASIGESRAFRVLAHVEDGLITILVFAIFAIVLAAVIARFGGVSLSWTTEISVTTMIWLTFLGMAIGVRDRVHVSFELFEDTLSGAARTFLLAIQLLVMGFLLVVLAYGGYELMTLGFEQVTPSGIPQWVSFSAIPVGSTLGLVHLAVNAWDLVTGVDPEAAHNDSDVVVA